MFIHHYSVMRELALLTTGHAEDHVEMVDLGGGDLRWALIITIDRNVFDRIIQMVQEVAEIEAVDVFD